MIKQKMDTAATMINLSTRKESFLVLSEASATKAVKDK